MKLIVILLLSVSAFAKEGDVLLSCDNSEGDKVEVVRTDLTAQISVRYQGWDAPKNPIYYAQGEEALDKGKLSLGVFNGKKIEFVRHSNNTSWTLRGAESGRALASEFKCK